MKRLLNPLVFSLIIVAIGIFWITRSVKNYNIVFQGIAESREQIVSYEFPVEINAIMVNEGQEIKSGTLLLKVSSPQLKDRIGELNQDIESLNNRKNQASGENELAISKLESEKTIRLNELNSELEQYQNQLRVNREMASELKSVEVDSNRQAGPLQLKIQSIQAEVINTQEGFDRRIEQQRNLNNGGFEEQIRSLQSELNRYLEAQTNLNVNANIDGLIGTINYGNGDQVRAFEPILILYQDKASTVRGYLHESMPHELDIGGEVRVISIQNSKMVSGTISGFGSRIVEFPVRFRKSPEMGLWGREVIITVDEENDFLIGEMVRIKMK